MKRIFVLDTNVLLHDSAAIYRFKEHDVFIPMAVLEELDTSKKGNSELARSARQASRSIENLIGVADQETIAAGLSLSNHTATDNFFDCSGRLFFQTEGFASDTVPFRSADDEIVAVARALAGRRIDVAVTLVSKDTNLRIKARLAGITAEDYYNDTPVEDLDLLYTGARALDADYWREIETQGERLENSGRRFIRVPKTLLPNAVINECVYTGNDHDEYIVRDDEHDSYLVEQAIDHRSVKNAVWGITARNREQNFALNLLMDPTIDFVSLLGVAGTGKTLLTLAAGLAQSIEIKRFREVLMTRETISLGEEIGFLPGSEEEKMTPWMGALLDNLEILTDGSEGGVWGQAASADILQSKIKIRSLGFMRGRTFLNRYIIVDEAQNLSAKQMRALITRAGPGTKIVCLGNVAQIDAPYLSETTSGLTYVIDRFRHWPHSGHITLRQGERSRLTEFATNNL